ncbi:MAG: hypothetical protein ABIT38_20330 [Gemmatimonadaceae bacterium]
MRTYPIPDSSGVPFAVEIENSYVPVGQLSQLLQKIDGVSDVSSKRRDGVKRDIRLRFRYRGYPFVVWEPFGDNSRYWIGPDDENASTVDITTLLDGLRSFEPPFWNQIVGDLLTLRFLRLPS